MPKLLSTKMQLEKQPIKEEIFKLVFNSLKTGNLQARKREADKPWSQEKYHKRSKNS